MGFEVKSFELLCLFWRKRLSLSVPICYIMFYTIKRVLVWVRRARYSRGFGVQSPWAYRFIRYVVNEHYPYYKYKQLEESVYGLDKRTRKLCRFYFRLSNYQQPHSFVDFCPPSPCYKFYAMAGSRRCAYKLITANKLIEESEGILATAGEYSVVRISLVDGYRWFVNKALDVLPSSCVLVIEQIQRDKETENYWKELISDRRTGVTFDLYYCGVVFLNTSVVKQNYIVNF